MRLYISGPMRGYKYFNFPEFDHAAGILRAKGHTVFNPAEHDREGYPEIEWMPGFNEGDPDHCPGWNVREAFRWDVDRIFESDGIVTLTGWWMSRGAQAEVSLACVIGVPLYRLANYALKEGPW